MTLVLFMLPAYTIYADNTVVDNSSISFGDNIETESDSEDDADPRVTITLPTNLYNLQIVDVNSNLLRVTASNVGVGSITMWARIQVYNTNGVKWHDQTHVFDGLAPFVSQKHDISVAN